MFSSKTLKQTEKLQELGLYIHIPFCAKKCDYCDFLSAPSDDETMKSYLDAMLIEIDQYLGKTDAYIIPTIFFGGGTPSYMKSKYIEKIMNKLRETFRIDENRLEATIEINPGTITEEKLRTYQRAGINRLSFGLQSVNKEELSLLGRIHTYEQFEENYYLARKMGFQNINIDLMSALPGQTLASWENSLNQVIRLEPEHISAYSLIIEEGTKFYDCYQKGTELYKTLPEEETERLMYHRTKELLQDNGYNRYEISNYAKIGYECRHNSSYWIGTQYLGFGIGAASLLQGTRFTNLRDIKTYIQLCRNNDILPKSQDKNLKNAITYRAMLEDILGIRSEFEVLDTQQQMEEFMFLGLRRCAGISKDAFLSRFSITVESVYGEVIRSLSDKALLELQGDTIRLTEYGMDISNFIFIQFLFD